MLSIVCYRLLMFSVSSLTELMIAQIIFVIFRLYILI